MSPTSSPPPPPPLGESLLRIFAFYFYWRPLWGLIKLRSQVRTIFGRCWAAVHGMTNAAAVIRAHRELMADVDRAQAEHAARGEPDPTFELQGRWIHERIVRILRMLDEVDESELREPLVTELAAVRRHLESALWAASRTAALAPKLAGLSKAEHGRQLEVELAALSQQADEIWGKP